MNTKILSAHAEVNLHGWIERVFIKHPLRACGGEPAKDLIDYLNSKSSPRMRR